MYKPAVIMGLKHQVWGFFNITVLKLVICRNTVFLSILTAVLSLVHMEANPDINCA